MAAGGSRPAWLPRSVAKAFRGNETAAAAVVVPSRPAWLAKSVAGISPSTGPLGANTFAAEFKVSDTCTNRHTGGHDHACVQAHTGEKNL